MQAARNWGSVSERPEFFPCTSRNFNGNTPENFNGNTPEKKKNWRSPVHDEVIKWKDFRCYLPFVQGIHRSPVTSTEKVQWRGALMFSLICAWINSWANNREAGDLRRHRAHYDVIVLSIKLSARANVDSVTIMNVQMVQRMQPPLDN